MRQLLWIGLVGAAAGAAGSPEERWVPVHDEGELSWDNMSFVDLNSLRFDRPVVTFARQRASPGSPIRNGQTETASVDCAGALKTGGQLELRESLLVCREARERRWAGQSSGRVGGLGASEVDPPPRLAPAPIARPSRPRLATGTGFVIAPGMVVTNHHVVDGCSRIRMRHAETEVEAELRASTARNDLALLKADAVVGEPAPVRVSALLGESVTVAGYPLAGLLASDIVVTAGSVNALAGLANDPSLVQISAPIQPGNSGGPLVDRSGSVVGVVVSKLDVERVAKVTGDLAQNVNFAIKPEILRVFLDANRVTYRTAALGAPMDGIQLAEAARRFTVQVICEK